MKSKVIIDGQEEEVELKPLTLFYGYNYKLDVPQAVVIDMSRAMVIAEGYTEQDIAIANKSPIFKACFRSVLREKENFKFPKTLSDFRSEGSGVRAVFVLVQQLLSGIMLNAELFEQGKLKIHVRYPETCLHPREQANLGDLFIKLMSGGFYDVQKDLDIGAY